MRRSLMVSLAGGLLAGGAIYALLEGIHLLSPPEMNAGAPVTEYERFESTVEGKPICPKCGHSDKVLQFLYGLRRGALPEGTTSGGCVVGPKSPEYRCGHCDARFGITSLGK